MANNILTFCPTDTGTNLLTQADYLASADRVSGNKPGVASAKLVNRSLRQSAFIASQFAQFISDQTGDSVLDDNDTAALLATINTAFNRKAITSKTANYTITKNDSVVLGDATGGAFALTLPSAAVLTGQTLTLQKTDSSVNKIQITGTISGVANRKLCTVGETVVLVSDGAAWTVLEHRTETGYVTYTPTVANFGTVTNLDASWRRTADGIILAVSFTNGTLAADYGSVTVPFSIDNTKWTKSKVIAFVGKISNTEYVSVVYNDTNQDHIYFGPNSNQSVAINFPTNIASNGGPTTFVTAPIPIADWWA